MRYNEDDSTAIPFLSSKWGLLSIIYIMRYNDKDNDNDNDSTAIPFLSSTFPP